jgi:hypothetical protein
LNDNLDNPKGGDIMSKIELEIKAQIEKDIYEAFEAKLKASGYNSKAEWLREQIRNFLGK